MNKRQRKKAIKKQRLKTATELFWLMQKHALEKAAKKEAEE